MARRGPKPGPRPGSMSDVLQRAKAGSVVWSEQTPNHVLVAASRCGVFVRTKLMLVVDPQGTSVTRLTRIEIMSRVDEG
jgi:hypothetical protein